MERSNSTFKKTSALLPAPILLGSSSLLQVPIFRTSSLLPVLDTAASRRNSNVKMKIPTDKDPSRSSTLSSKDSKLTSDLIEQDSGDDVVFLSTSESSTHSPTTKTPEECVLQVYETFRTETKDIDLSTDNRVVFNVSGTLFETFKTTLQNAKGVVPPLRDHNFLSSHWDNEKQQYYFDRRPAAFRVVLNYVRTGNLHLPNGHDSLCSYMITKEMSFWGILDVFVEPCCWKDNLNRFLFLENYKRLQNDKTLGLNTKEPTNFRQKMYAFVAAPQSSKAAMAYLYVTLLFVFIGIITFAIRTADDWQIKKASRNGTLGNATSLNSTDMRSDLWHAVQSCMMFMDKAELAFFSFDFLTNLLCCPVWYKYIVSFQGLVDGLPLLLDCIALTGTGALDITEKGSILRAFRPLRLCNRVKPILIVKHTLINTAGDLFVMVILLLIVVVIISSVTYHNESHYPGTDFTSIPQSCWWGVITMTHVGYGDMVPQTFFGRIVGSIAAFMELLVLGLMIPPLQQSFNSFSEILTTMQYNERTVESLGNLTQVTQFNANYGIDNPIDPTKLRRRRSGLETSRLPHERVARERHAAKLGMPFYDMLI